MSALGVNLHQIVRSVIPILHPDETVFLVQSTGSVNVRGRITPQYAPVIAVGAQIQSLGSDELQAMESEARTKISRKAYLFSQTPNQLIPQGIIRALKRGGDLICRPDGSWWLVTGMTEDFSGSGWVCVNITEQIEVPAEVEKMVAEYLKKDLVASMGKALELYQGEEEPMFGDDIVAKAVYDLLLAFHPKPEAEPEEPTPDENDGEDESGDVEQEETEQEDPEVSA